jgi:copper chaperone CopZ
MLKRFARPVILGLAAVLLAAGTALAGERTVVLTMPDMDCGSKIMKVQWFLNDLEGVKKAVVDQNYPTATVTFDDGATSLEKIEDGLAGEGFPVEEAMPAGEAPAR